MKLDTIHSMRVTAKCITESFSLSYFDDIHVTLPLFFFPASTVAISVGSYPFYKFRLQIKTFYGLKAFVILGGSTLIQVIAQAILSRLVISQFISTLESKKSRT